MLSHPELLMRGGTGKYDGITASHEYSFDAVNTPDATEFTSTALRKGRYRLRATK